MSRWFTVSLDVNLVCFECFSYSTIVCNILANSVFPDSAGCGQYSDRPHYFTVGHFTGGKQLDVFTYSMKPQARAYLHSDVVTMSFSASDAGSGLAAGMQTARLDGVVVANGQGISMLTLALGTHNFVLTAADVAGNSRSLTVTFTVVATIDSLISSVNVFAGQNKIDDSNTIKSLLAKLNDAKQAAQRGSNTAAINKLQEFIDLVRAQSGQHITVDAAQILVADAQYVIGTLR